MRKLSGTAYEIAGPENAPCVVLIHGLGLTRFSTWGTILPALAERYRVISYDLLGHGESDPPGQPVTLSALSDQLIALMDGLSCGKPAVIDVMIDPAALYSFRRDSFKHRGS
jgi:(E)-2-((N-methylformamido)methylene)succinate hydrolase